jgi:hypothetical protein
MKCISLICAVHEETGHASVSELHSILERLDPQVIFLEAPEGAMDDFYRTGHRKNLESTAIGEFRERNHVELIPVDLPTPHESFFRDYHYMVKRIEGISSEYRRLRLWDSNYVRDRGFAYLNSECSEKIWSETYDELEAVIQKLNEPRLTKIFDQWIETNDLRENEMLSNIMQYCSSNSFDRGTFLIGAAHRKRVIHKIRKAFDECSSNIQWDWDWRTNNELE